MHFVNASQIGPRKFIGTLGGAKNSPLRPLKGTKTPSVPNDGSCTKAVAWIHIVVHISCILLFLLLVLALILNGKTDGSDYGYLSQLNSSDAFSHKAFTIIVSICLFCSILGLGMSIVLLNAEKERNIFKLKLWILYTVVICCITLPLYVWKLGEGPLWKNQGKLLGFVGLFSVEIIFLWIVATFVRKLQTQPPPPPLIPTEV